MPDEYSGRLLQHEPHVTDKQGATSSMLIAHDDYSTRVNMYRIYHLQHGKSYA